MYKQYKVGIHIDVMLHHNGRLSDPLNKYAKAMKAISGKRKKTDADHEALACIEYEGSLYLSRTGDVIIPGKNFEAMIAEGARKSKEGKNALAGTFVDNDAVMSYDGGPLTLAELLDSESHRDVSMVRIGTSRVPRTRPKFENVMAEFIVSAETTVVNEASLRRWIVDGLTLVGLGDFRPRHGRGSLTKFEAIVNPLSIAAE